MIRTRPLPAELVVIEADPAECAALARRFGIPAVTALHAEITLAPEDAAIRAAGTLTATLVQACAVSGEDFKVAVAEPIELKFVRESTLPTATSDDGAIEVELSAEASDEIEYVGDAFDLGEAIAQTLGLAIDPYAEGPGADAARLAVGLSDETAPSGPLAEALAALKKP